MDRLKELRKNAGATGDEIELEETNKKGDSKDNGKGKDATNIGNHMKQYEDIKVGISLIRKNAEAIERLRSQEQRAVNEKERKDIMAELDRIMQETSNTGVKIKSQLDKIKVENDKFSAQKENQNSATTQMRLNLYQTHIRRFHSEMNAYNQAAQDFKVALKERTRRQLPILVKDITPEKVEEIVESGHAEEVISEALISEDLDNVIHDIEERHKGIMRLERQVLEVYELFRDLATLVDLQQETMDIISERIDKAKDFTAQAERELQSAEEQAKKARQKQCIIFIIVLVILIVIIAPVMYTQLQKS